MQTWAPSAVLMSTVNNTELCQACHTERTRSVTNRLEAAAGSTRQTLSTFHCTLRCLWWCFFPLKSSWNLLHAAILLCTCTSLLFSHQSAFKGWNTQRGPVLEKKICRNVMILLWFCLCHFLSVLGCVGLCCVGLGGYGMGWERNYISDWGTVLASALHSKFRPTVNPTPNSCRNILHRVSCTAKWAVFKIHRKERGE